MKICNRFFKSRKLRKHVIVASIDDLDFTYIQNDLNRKDPIDM